MATNKSAKSAATKKAAPKKAVSTTVRTVSAKTTPARASGLKLDNNIINIVLAELVGTFVLTLVALLAVESVLPLFVGLTLAVLVLAIGAVSGAHVNPAVTFGLWATRKLKSSLVPFYWVAQLLGAMAAVVVTSAIAGTKVGLDFSHFGTFSWPIFWIELVGTGVFLFGLVSVLSRKGLSDSGKAVGVGLSLFVALLVASSLYAPMRQAAITKYQDSVSSNAASTSAIPHEIYVSGATLNPAVALAATETSEAQLRGTTATKDEKSFSRLSLEVILGTLIGAALGGNLALLLGYRFRD